MKNQVNILPTLDAGKHGSIVRWKSEISVPKSELKKLIKDKGRKFIKSMFEGWNASVDLNDGKIYLMAKPNLVVNVGVQRSLNRLFAINGTPSALVTMGVDNGTTNPTATSVSSTAGGGTDTGSSLRRLIVFDSTPTLAAQTVTTIGTFTNANVAFAMKRLFLSAQTAGTTDASGTLYAMTNVFTIDLTAFSTWSQTFTATVLGTGS